MNIPKKDLKIETMRGQGPGGQHKNKTDSAVRITHIPTGISVTIDGRKQGQNKKIAIKELKDKLQEYQKKQRDKEKKARRDEKIKDKDYIRTYDYTRGIVIDHRTGKTASLKQILKKGRLDLLKKDKEYIEEYLGKE